MCTIEQRGKMTQETKNRVASLRKSTAKYSLRVARKFASTGTRRDAAVMQSAAKYYVALKQLAEK
jgi:hypothetical protein